jgi:hypothetical protein
MSISRRSFFTKLAGVAVATQVVPPVAAPVYGSTGGAHVGLIPGTLARQRMEWAIVSARWKWAVLGKDAPTFMAPDPFDRRDAICFEGGE